MRFADKLPELRKQVEKDLARKQLGNTPAVAKGSHIDVRVFNAHEDGVTLGKLRKTMTTMRPKKYLSVDEQCVLKLLQK